ncbi:MAG: hypothetical protein IJ370_04825 [Oscillospiraceae bacterium]|nr:hypothetical protein [Oscillospiraceae bacterium]
MNKIVAAILIICIAFSFCFVSCKGEEKDVNVSSQISYYEDSSTIAKTENDGNYTFNFDPYVLPTDVKKALGTTEHYKNVVDAIITKKDSVPVPTRDDYDNIRFALGENFPFAFLVSELKYDSAKNSVLISYNFEDEHSTKVDEIKKAVEGIFSECLTKSDDDALAAISIYGWLAKNIEISAKDIKKPEQTVSSNIAQTESSSIATNETENNNDKYDFYTALVNKKANDESVSALYSFLLMQLGIESKSASSWIGGEYYSWNLVCLNSKWYHCDITKEQKETDGTGLKFFGMNSERLGEYITNKEISVGQWKWFSQSIPKTRNKRFDDLKSVVSYEISADRASIDAFTEEYSRFVFDF